MKDQHRRYLHARLADAAREQPQYMDWPEPDGTFDDVLQDAWLEAARDLDPLASNSALLEVRLSGEPFDGGDIDFQRAEAFLPIFRKEVEAAAAKPGQARMALAGVGVGSVVLVLRPVDAVAPAHAGEMALPVSQVDSAIRLVMQLHDALGEPKVEAPAIAERFNQSLLNAAARLVRTLADWDAELAMTWSPTIGRNVRSSLDRSAQRRALSLFEEVAIEEPGFVHGRVVEMSLAGHFAVKPAQNAAQRRIYVSGDRIQGLGLNLGDLVSVLVTRTIERDSVGRENHERLDFVRFASQDDGEDSLL